jgi:hypothetical protein
MAWLLVACQRGYDCSSKSEWLMMSCTYTQQCASYANPTDFVRDAAGDDWPDVQQRAREIADSIDAGRWNELGLSAVKNDDGRS